MRAHLVRIDARLPDGQVVPVRLSSVNDVRACHLDGYQWDPAVLAVPVLRYDFFGGAFQNAVTVPTADFTVAVGAMAQVPADLLAALRFGSARVQIWSGELGDPFHAFSLRFSGEIKAEPAIDQGMARFTAGAGDAWMDVPLLATYAGTDGLEGPEGLTGTVKALVLGKCRFVPGVLIDPVDNVYQVSAYGPVQAISAAYDRVGSLGAAAGNHASLSALLSASIPNGSWATCLAQGLVRLGAPADGKVCFDVDGDAGGSGGYVTRAGGMIGRLIELAGGTCDAAVLAQLDAARPWDQGRVLSDQVTARQMIQELADSVAAVAGITWTGAFFVKAYGFSAPTVTLDAAGGSEPQVLDVSQQPVDPPFWRLATTAAPTWQVHDLGEIASAYTPRGIYSATRVYRLDDLVSASDGRSFVYVNATPGSGNAPPTAPATSNAWWALFNAATAGAPSGTTVAGRDAEDVASTIAAGGGVDTDQVATDSILDNAVSESGFAFTASGTLLGTSYSDLQSLVVVADGVTPVVIFYALAYYRDTDNADAECALYRDSTPLVTLDKVPVTSGNNPTMSGIWSDVPAAGTYTYYLKGKATDASEVGAKNRALLNLSLKK